MFVLSATIGPSSQCLLNDGLAVVRGHQQRSVVVVVVWVFQAELSKVLYSLSVGFPFGMLLPTAKKVVVGGIALQCLRTFGGGY